MCFGQCQQVYVVESEVHLSYSVNPFKATGPMITVNGRTSSITSMLASFPGLSLSPVFDHLYNVQKLEMGRPVNEALLDMQLSSL